MKKYNKFFEKFKRTNGYIGSLAQMSSKNVAFEFEFNKVEDNEKAILFLNKLGVKIIRNRIVSNKILAII